MQLLNEQPNTIKAYFIKTFDKTDTSSAFMKIPSTGLILKFQLLTNRNIRGPNTEPWGMQAENFARRALLVCPCFL